MGQEAEGVRRQCRQEPFWWFPWEGMGMEGKQAPGGLVWGISAGA